MEVENVEIERMRLHMERDGKGEMNCWAALGTVRKSTILKNADDNSPIAFNDKVHGIVIRDKTALLGVLEQFDWSKKYESFRVQLSNYGFSFRQVPNLGDAWVNPDVASLDAILAMETTAPKKRKAA